MIIPILVGALLAGIGYELYKGMKPQGTTPQNTPPPLGTPQIPQGTTPANTGLLPLNLPNLTNVVTVPPPIQTFASSVSGGPLATGSTALVSFITPAGGTNPSTGLPNAIPQIATTGGIIVAALTDKVIVKTNAAAVPSTQMGVPPVPDGTMVYAQTGPIPTVGANLTDILNTLSTLPGASGSTVSS